MGFPTKGRGANVSHKEFVEVTDGGVCYVVEIQAARSGFVPVGDDRLPSVSWNDSDLKVREAMICPRCREAGRKLGQGDAAAAKDLHDLCPGGTWCYCAHATVSSINLALVQRV